MNRIACLLLAALIGEAAAQEAPKWGAHIDFEAKPGTKRNLGEADLFVPLWQDGRSLLFGSFRGRLDDDDGREGNLGVGLRRMYEGGWNLGGYGYFDRRKTGNGNYFNQATLGGEALGRNWDFRANAYLPYDDRVKDAGTASTASLSGSTVVVNSVTSEERALKGFDAEVGWRVPLFDAEAPRQLRVYAGGYRFKDDVAKVSGPRVRAELTMAELSGLWSGARLMVSAEAQDDDLRGSQSFLSLRLRIPLGGKETPRGLSWQERRMTAPVVRDVDIVAPVVARAPVIETATAASGNALVVLDSGATTGAALPGAVTAAGANSTVILTGTYSTTASVVLQPGQTVAGAGPIRVSTPSGRTAVLTGPGATVNADLAGSVFILANSSTLAGMTINATHTSPSPSSTAVRAVGVSNVTISNNTITAMVPAPAILNDGIVQGIQIGGGSTNIVVSNNTIVLAGPSAGNQIGNILGINASNGGFGTVTISGNTVTLSGNGSIKHAIGAAGGVPGGTIATIIGNTLSVTGGGGANQAVFITTSAITAGSTGNVRVAGICAWSGTGTSGFIGFTDGTPCP